MLIMHKKYFCHVSHAWRVFPIFRPPIIGNKIEIENFLYEVCKVFFFTTYKLVDNLEKKLYSMGYISRILYIILLYEIKIVRTYIFIIIVQESLFPVWLRSRLLPVAGQEQVLSNSEKSCIASYYRQFSTTNIKISIIIFGPSRRTKLVLLIIFIFDNRGKLFIIRCNK